MTSEERSQQINGVWDHKELRVPGVKKQGQGRDSPPSQVWPWRGRERERRRRLGG